MSSPISGSLSRSRWAAVGAAVAVSFGAGGIGLIAHAAGSAPSSFVSIAPCRLFDTRPAPDTVSDRNTPLDAGEEFVRQVWGSNGNCSIPTAATGISYNLTVPSGLDGYLTVFPADEARPLTSSINPVSAEGTKSNSGIVGLSATGAIKVFTMAGPQDALLDITGYYLPAGGTGGGAGAAGATGAKGATGATGDVGPRGFSSWDVIPSGQTVIGTIIYDTHGSTDTSSDTIGVDLPGIAPVALTDATVSLSANPPTGGEADPTCDGTTGAPTAPTGKVCIYVSDIGGVTPETIFGIVGDLPTRSFLVRFDPIGDNDSDEFLFATWAYTAP